MPSTRDDYPEEKVFCESDGVVAVITRKAGTEYLAFCFAKQFDRDGKTLRTAFLNRRHIASVRRLLLLVEEYLDAEADRALARAATPAGHRARARSTTQNG